MKTVFTKKNKSKLTIIILLSVSLENYIMTNNDQSIADNYVSYNELREEINTIDDDPSARAIFCRRINNFPLIDINHKYEDIRWYNQNIYNEKIKNKTFNQSQYLNTQLRLDRENYVKVKVKLTLLNYAVEQNDFNLVKELVKKGADINQVYRYQGSTLDKSSQKIRQFLDSKKALNQAGLEHDQAKAEYDNTPESDFYGNRLNEVQEANYEKAQENLKAAQTAHEQARSGR